VRPFRYQRAGDPGQAVGLLAGEPEAKFLGGGTNLVDLMRLGVEAPAMLVDVSRLPEDRIEETDDGGLRIGAAVTNSALAADERVRRRYPVLSQALLNGASGQLRNKATVGGNLLQRTRCLYFQDVTKPCNKREGGRDPNRCPARTGIHRDLAIFGQSELCVATHPSDMAVAMSALDAVVHTDRRAVPINDFHRLPGDAPERDTVLERDELITAVELPPIDATHSLYQKARERRSFAFALVSVAAVRDGERVRLALGGVAHKPWRATRAEEVLIGGPLTADRVADAAEQELALATPLSDNRFKVALAQKMIVRAVLDLP
jgi:xanthine dehydrogenase YagS FAD-binding subunit